MTEEELRALIRNGENSGVEFKRDDVSGESLAAEMVALANLRGGKILLGVADDGTVTGLTRSAAEEFVMNIARDRVSPGLIPFYEEVEIERGTRVAVVSVESGLAKPYAAMKHGKPSYYIRVGSTNRSATREELGRLFQASGAVHPDLSPVIAADALDLDPGRVREFFLTNQPSTIDLDELSAEDRTRLLCNALVLVEWEGMVKPSLWAMLLFGRTPQKHVPQAEVRYAHYRGNDLSGELLDDKTFDGTLIDVLERTVTVLTDVLPVRSVVEGVRRVEFPSIPGKVLREALVNAMCHRQYAITGPIRVLLFGDRLEVVNPGAPPNGVTPENMRAGVSVPRNYFLVQNLKNRGYIDQLGRGLPMIFAEVKRASGQDPAIRIEGDQTRLVIPRADAAGRPPVDESL